MGTAEREQPRAKCRAPGDPAQVRCVLRALWWAWSQVRSAPGSCAGAATALGALPEPLGAWRPTAAKPRCREASRAAAHVGAVHPLRYCTASAESGAGPLAALLAEACRGRARRPIAVSRLAWRTRPRASRRLRQGPIGGPRALPQRSRRQHAAATRSLPPSPRPARPQDTEREGAAQQPAASSCPLPLAATPPLARAFALRSPFFKNPRCFATYSTSPFARPAAPGGHARGGQRVGSAAGTPPEPGGRPDTRLARVL
jgi:hypothetical protein